MESLNTELWNNPIWTSPAKCQTLGVWFKVTRAYMLVKFGMDTEQIVANATNIFWMHSFISGHKKVEYIFRNHVSIAHVNQRCICRNFEQLSANATTSLLDIARQCRHYHSRHPELWVLVIVRRAGLMRSQQDFEWWWSVPLSSASLY